VETKHVIELLGNSPRFQAVRQMTVSALKRFLRLSRFEDHLDFERIRATTRNSSLEGYDFAVDAFRKWSHLDIAPPLLVSGSDLIEMGFKPGPVFKEILTRVEDEQLEGRILEKQQALSFISVFYSEEAS